MDFNTAFADLIGNEGRYVNDPNDPGGETNWGISKRSYPNVDIKNLTIDVAKVIYLHDFWIQSGADRLPVIGFDLFDAAVNHGVSRSVKLLQAAVGTAQDGIIGPATLTAANSRAANVLHVLFNAQRLLFYTSLDGWDDDGKGWARRVANDLIIGATT